MSPGTDHRGQAADGADGHSTSGVPLHPVIDSDRGRWSGAVFPGELFDVVGGDPGDVRRSLRRPVTGHPFFESLGSHAVPFHVVTVDQAVAEQDVHQSQRQGRIGSDPRSDMPITPFGGAAPVGVDCHDAGSLLSGPVHPHPEVHVGDGGIGTPVDDVPRLGKRFGIGAHHVADGCGKSDQSCGRADGPEQLRGPQSVEEPTVQALALNLAQCAREAVRKHLLGVIERDDPVLDLLDRLLPADVLKCPDSSPALGADSFHRVEDPIGVFHSFEVA